MTKGAAKVASIAASVICPFIVQAVLVTLEHYWRDVVPWSGNGSSLVVSSLVGFAFLVWAFRIYSLLLAPVYFPILYYALIGFSLGLAGAAFDNWL
jgi:hypothetical protein